MDVDGYSAAVMAWSWGYSIVRMEQVAREYTDVPSPKPATSYRAPLNQIGWATELATVLNCSYENISSDKIEEVVMPPQSLVITGFFSQSYVEVE
ncbi:hypothetical protein [Erwinia sp.]|uniref:hypothetical protein n=1 Tax=Erwinia citreus TaxID=558 RepID=UPI003C750736